MEYGRSISPQDKDILRELQTHWKKSVKIDFDITHEPCIFFNYCGVWNLVYKLSKDGSYLRTRWSYVRDIDDAIIHYIEYQRSVSIEDEQKYQSNFASRRSKFTGEEKESYE